MFAGHVMAFEHVVHVGDGALEFADQLGWLIDTPMKAVTSLPSCRASTIA